jgi:hypothetical protein
MLTPSQHDEFERSGLLRLPGAVPVGAAAAMRHRFWEFLSTERGIDPHRPETWPSGAPRRLQALRRSGAFAAMASDGVRAALDDLLGAGGWREPDRWGLPLVTFPVPGGRWGVPTTGWHLDSFGPDHDLPGVTVFAFLGSVAGHGGGTAVLTGSHHLVNRHITATGTWRPADVRAALAAAHPWLRDLWAGRPTAAADDDLGVGLRELTGDPGDVVLMHPRTLHAAAPNTAVEPRMMLVEIVGRA